VKVVKVITALIRRKNDLAAIDIEKSSGLTPSPSWVCSCGYKGGLPYSYQFSTASGNVGGVTSTVLAWTATNSSQTMTLVAPRRERLTRDLRDLRYELERFWLVRRGRASTMLNRAKPLLPVAVILTATALGSRSKRLRRG
jgi:hypothetical protein